MKSTQPLNQTDLNNLNDGLRQLNEFRQHISQAKQAGLDVSEFERQAQHYEDRFNSLKASYFPPK